MSYTELEHGYQGLRKATRPTQFYIGAVSYFRCLCVRIARISSKRTSFHLVVSLVSMNSDQIQAFREQVVPSVLVEDVDSPLLSSSFWVLFACAACVCRSAGAFIKHMA